MAGYSVDAERRATALKAEGNALFGAQKYAEANAKYEEALAVGCGDSGPSPAHASVVKACHLNRAQCALRLGKYAQCIADCTTVLDAFDPKSLKAFYRRGQAHLGLANYAMAKGDLERAHALDESDEAIAAALDQAKRKGAGGANETAATATALELKNEGNALFGAQKYAEATAKYTQALASGGRQGDAAVVKACHLNRAQCALHLGEYAKCIADCDVVVSTLDPMSLKAFYRRGQAHLGLANFAKAEIDLKRAHALDPKDDAVAAALAQAKGKQGSKRDRPSGASADSSNPKPKAPRKKKPKAPPPDAATLAAAFEAERSKPVEKWHDGWMFQPPSLLFKEFNRFTPHPALGSSEGGQGEGQGEGKREGAGGVAGSSGRVAAFDFDGTIVRTRSGGYQRGPSDWCDFNGKTFKILKKLHEEGKAIVVFSNQGSIGAKGLQGERKGAMRVTKRFDNALTCDDKVGNPRAQFPVLVFISTTNAKKADAFRKPNDGMWRYFVESYLPQRLGGEAGGVSPEALASRSLYAGDQAGRADDMGSDDAGFAEAAGLAFKTPEALFGPSGGKKAVPQREEGVPNLNAPVCAVLERIAKKFEEQASPDAEGGGTNYKANAFKKAAASLANCGWVVESGAAAAKLPGIGKGIAAKVDEFIRTGKVALLEELEDVGGERAAKAKRDAEEKAKGEAFAFID